MSTTKFEHVIGRDGLHRIRKTRVENGEIIGNSHEGFGNKSESRASEALNFEACLLLVGFSDGLANELGNRLIRALADIPTVDARPTACSASDIGGDLPNDPLEPQTQTPEN